MSYDTDLADRIRRLLIDEPDVTERAMFGGLSFMVESKMVVAASSRGGMLVRVDPLDMDALIASTVAETMDMGSQTMRGWVHVPGEELRTQRQLSGWVARGVAYAASLPVKKSSAKKVPAKKR